MNLSIIIVNWNTCQVTLNCLESIFINAPEKDFEVIVIDNNSQDDSVHMILEHFPQVILIRNDDNIGFAGANNIGIKRAKGDFILLLNSDTIILDNALDKVMEYYNAIDNCGFLGCKVLNDDRSLQPTCFMFPSITNLLISIPYLNKLFPRNSFLGREQMTWWNRDDKRDVQTVTGCFMFIKNDILQDIGLMDDSFFMYGEETDLCYRSIRKGYRNQFYPGAEIIHLGGASTSKIKPQMILQLRSGILQFVKKNHSQIYYSIFCVLISSWFLIRVPYWGIKSVMDKRNLIYFKTYLKGIYKSLGGYKALSVR